MKICLIAEGSYPYVTGGVSSWINHLMTNLPEHEFIVLAINPESCRGSPAKYKYPVNLTQVIDVFIDDFSDAQANARHVLKASPGEREQVRQLMAGEVKDWPELFQVFQAWQKTGYKPVDILFSTDFFGLALEIYNTRFAQLPFAEVFWTLRSMYHLAFNLLLKAYPEADLYHSVSTGYAGLVGSYAATVHNRPLLLTEHGIYTREREEEIIKADWAKGYFKNIWINYFSNLSTCIYACAEKVVTLSDRNREIQCDLGCPVEKTMIIHNGINVSAYSDIAEAVRQREDRAKVMVGAIIRVVPIKDIKTMLQAFAFVSRKLPEVSFTILGPTDEDPEYYQECLSYLHLLDLRQVVFTGTVDIKAYLKEIDLLVLTSISEGQPLAILEGLACTIPQIVTDVGDCRVMINGRNDDFGPAGRVVPIMDYIAIGESIIDLCQNYQLRRQMGEAGLKRVRASYSFDQFIDGYRTIYSGIRRRDS